MARGTRPVTLSFVVPAYDVAAHLPACLDSLLADSGEAVEVVVVDDASPDRCPAIADDYARRDSRVRAVHLPTNVGAGQARNFGLDSATGEYVWCVDGDDRLPVGSVPAVQARLAVHRPDVLVVDHAEVSVTGAVTPSRPPGLLATISGPVTLLAHPELLRPAQSACTKIVRRELLEETKLRFATGWYEDSAFSHSLLLAAGSIDVLDRVCYLYRQWERGITRTASPRHFDVFDQYRRLFERLDEHPHGERYRPLLFRLMIDHYLVIAGHEARLPAGRRREFFARVHAEFHARMPPSGYEPPSGPARLKHYLVRRGAYRTYAALRAGNLRLRPRRTPGTRQR